MKQKLLFLLFIGLTTSWAQNPINSLDFDGSNDYVSATLPTIFNDIPNNDLTVEAWIKPNGTSFSRVLFAQLNTSNFVSLSLSTSNEIYFYVSNVSGEKSTSTLQTGVWSHVACTWDASTNLIEIYVNGVLETTTGGGTSSTGTDNLMSIGCKTDGSQPFEGELDELRIWNTLRTECQITASMNSEFTNMPTNLIAYYNFNEGTAAGNNATITTLNDITTSYDGTLINFALTGTASNWLASGATINLLNQTSGFSSTDVQTGCDSYTWIDGNTYTADNNSATHLLQTAAGCDSLVTLDLTINTVNAAVSQVGNVLTATQSGVGYQWVNCDGMTDISGATNQSFTATSNGDYAVTVNNNGCEATSTCLTVSGLNLNENGFNSELVLFPNPTHGDFSIDLGYSYESTTVTITNMDGKVVQSHLFSNKQLIELNLTQPAGVYIVIIQSDDENRVLQMIKE